MLISIEDPIDLPSAAQLGAAVPLVRKQDFGPQLADAGSGASTAAEVARRHCRPSTCARRAAPAARTPTTRMRVTRPDVAGERGGDLPPRSRMCAVTGGDHARRAPTSEYAWLEALARALDGRGRRSRSGSTRAAGRRSSRFGDAAGRSRASAGSSPRSRTSDDAVALQRRARVAAGSSRSVLVYLVLAFPIGPARRPCRPRARRGDRRSSSRSSTCRRRCSSSSYPLPVAADVAATPAARTTRSWCVDSEPAFVEDVVRPAARAAHDRCSSRPPTLRLALAHPSTPATLMRRALAPVLARRRASGSRALRGGARRAAARARLADRRGAVVADRARAARHWRCAFLVGLVRWWLFIAQRDGAARDAPARAPRPRGPARARSPRRSTTRRWTIVYWLERAPTATGRTPTGGRSISPSFAARARRDRGPRRRPARRRDRPRPGAGGRPRLRRRGDVVRR